MSQIVGADLDPSHRKARHFLLVLLATAAVAGLIPAATSPWKALAVVVSVVVGLLAITKPERVILLLAVYTPFEPFLLKFVNDELYVYARYFSEGIIYVLGLVVILDILGRRRKLAPTPLDLPFVLFLITAVASIVINAVVPVAGVLGIRQIIRFILLFFITVIIAPEKKFIQQFLKVMFAVMLFQATLGIVQAATGGALDPFLLPSDRKFFESVQLTAGTDQFWSPGTRIFATMGRYDQLGTFLSFFMLIAVGLLYAGVHKIGKKPLEKGPVNLPQLALVLAVPALILTLSRASWFGFLLGLLLIGGWYMRDSRVRFAFVAFIAIVLGYLFYSGVVVRYITETPSTGVVERFFEAFSPDRWRGEYVGLGRMYWLVQTPLVVVRSSPLFGVGPGQYGGGAAAALGNTKAYEKLNLPFGVFGTEGYIDNNWFSLWGETGTIGLIFYLWMYLTLAALALKVWRESEDPLLKGLALGYFGALAAVALQAGLGTYLEVRTLALYVWLIGALVYVQAKREKLV